MSLIGVARRQASGQEKLSANVCWRSLALMLTTVFVLGCATKEPPPKLGAAMPTQAWSVTRTVHTDHSMITLLDPSDLIHHQAEPANWFLHDFAIKDDLATGRFSAVLTERSGNFNVRVTFGELSPAEQAAAGPEARVRLRVINHRLLLSGGDAWPSEETDYRRYAHDQRWISIPNGDYGVIITALKPGATPSDYVFQLIRVNSMVNVKYAPGVPQLIYGEKASVVGVNASGFHFNEQCLDVPGKATWVPLSSRTMPIPGFKQPVVLPAAVHSFGLSEQQAGNNATLSMVLSRNPEVGAYGFFLKPRTWNSKQMTSGGDAQVNTLIRCAVQVTNVVATPTDFSLQIKAIPTASDRLSVQQKKQVIDGFNEWLRNTNDKAWRFKSAKVQRSTSDAAMILGMVQYLQLSSKETEKLLPMSNALRADYLLERFGKL